jgi:hypothetical protein
MKSEIKFEMGMPSTQGDLSGAVNSLWGMIETRARKAKEYCGSGGLKRLSATTQREWMRCLVVGTAEFQH